MEITIIIIWLLHPLVKTLSNYIILINILILNIIFSRYY